MATPYTEIYERFVSKVSDYDILQFDRMDREDLLFPHLKSAIVKFKKICKIDLLDRDEDLKQFNNDLDDDVVDILAIGMVYYWVTPYVMNTDNLKNVLNTKDFNMYSPANLLEKLNQLRDIARKDFRRSITDYSYDNGDLQGLKE